MLCKRAQQWWDGAQNLPRHFWISTASGSGALCQRIRRACLWHYALCSHRGQRNFGNWVHRVGEEQLLHVDCRRRVPVNTQVVISRQNIQHYARLFCASIRQCRKVFWADHISMHAMLQASSCLTYPERRCLSISWRLPDRHRERKCITRLGRT